MRLAASLDTWISRELGNLGRATEALIWVDRAEQLAGETDDQISTLDVSLTRAELFTLDVRRGAAMADRGSRGVHETRHADANAACTGLAERARSS